MSDRQPVENFETHRARHRMLHSFLDELYADFISQRPHYEVKEPELLSDTTVNELIRWSFEQTQNPTVPAGYEYLAQKQES